MRKEWIMFIFSVTITLMIALGLVRWFAPGLLGIPVDLQLVRVAKEVPPFFDGVFRREDLESSNFLLQDPHVLVRVHPFYPVKKDLGPTDILGFRNYSVPNMADVIILGDSQTYGNNVLLENNWPEQLRRLLSSKNPEIYSMAVGGWSPIPYLYMFSKATAFRPKVVVIAFYSGNDSLESFKMAYSMDEWRFLIPDSSLGKEDAPHVVFPSPKSEWWPVIFSDGVNTTFTPALRLSSNSEHPAVKAGYDIIGDVAKRISEMAKPFELKLIFTIIPTKELVYSKKVQQENLNAPDDYKSLIERESENIQWLVNKLSSIDNARYVDVVAPLQEAALGSVALYPKHMDGHPVAAGYNVIANALFQSLDKLLPERQKGLFLLETEKGKRIFLLLTNKGYWIFKSLEMVEGNDWSTENVKALHYKDIVRLPKMGIIDQVDALHFGPKSIQ